MEDISIVIGRKKIHLGDNIKDLKLKFSSNESLIKTDDNGNIVLMQLPIAFYSSIEFRGKKYKTVSEIFNEHKDTRPNQLVFCCGDSEDMIITTEDKIDLSICPFDSENINMCANICFSIPIFRGSNTIGFDMADVMFRNGIRNTVIAIPGHAWRLDNE